VPPAISQRKAAELSARWRRQLRRVVSDHNLDPSAAISQLAARAGSSQRNRFYAVLTGFGDYSSEELSALWQADGHYRPDTWLAQWEQAAASDANPSLPDEEGAADDLAAHPLKDHHRNEGSALTAPLSAGR